MNHVVVAEEERPLPDGSLYHAHLKKCFPNGIATNLGSSVVYVCGSVQNPRILKVEGQMTLGTAISKCGGFKNPLGIYIFRRRDETFSVITIRLGVDSKNLTSYERTQLRKDDLVAVTEESY